MEFDLGPPPATVPPLSPREVHLWRIRLDHPPAAITRLAECLSPEEHQRAERFVRDEDRQRFIVSHAALRMILGQYLGVPPGQVEMVVAASGKPSLASPNLPPLHFNLSHSEDLALVGVVLDRQIGVDVEHWRPLVDAESIVKRYFAPGERARWQALPDHERLTAFYLGWTRKEAYLKARGVGLSAGLDRFEVSLVPGESTRLVEGGDTNDSATPWQVYPHDSLGVDDHGLRDAVYAVEIADVRTLVQRHGRREALLLEELADRVRSLLLVDGVEHHALAGIRLRHLLNDLGAFRLLHGRHHVAQKSRMTTLLPWSAASLAPRRPATEP